MAPPARRLGAVRDHLAQQLEPWPAEPAPVSARLDHEPSPWPAEPSPVSAQLDHLAPPAGDPVPLSDEEVKRFSTRPAPPHHPRFARDDTARFAQSSMAIC